jgi:hypothetical protein
VELREEPRDRLRGGLHVELYEYWTDKPHKRRKGTGMNLEPVEYKIAKSVENSVLDPVWVSVRRSVGNSVEASGDDSVVDFVRNSVDFGLTDPIREEREQG